MSTFVGIDYGSKRVGVAVTDKSGSVAFPKASFPNDRTLVPSLVALLRHENAQTVVIGSSQNREGADNAIMPRVRRFAVDLQQAIAVTVRFEPEFYSSAEARKTSGKAVVDAEAAAIILNSFLSRTKGTPEETPA
ncbi:MAG: Holliday junction resolvase RuvX [Patescibacteria group bacterium]